MVAIYTYGSMGLMTFQVSFHVQDHLSNFSFVLIQCYHSFGDGSLTAASQSPALASFRDDRIEVVRPLCLVGAGWCFGT